MTKMIEKLQSYLLGKIDYARATMPGRPEAQLLYLRRSLEILHTDPQIAAISDPGDDIAHSIEMEEVS